MLTSTSLIILLILGDTLQSVVFIVLPTMELMRGPVASTSGACQASGFFLMLGFEATDVAVVLVALHTALYIFRGRGGLYPFRRLAFSSFLLVPLLLGSLAFLNKPAFTNSGRYCHLPQRPKWASLALNWIPRYLIFITISVTYISTYVHVHILMNGFGAACQGGSVPGPEPAGPDGDGVVSAPPTPTVTRDCLLPPPPPCEGPDPPAGGDRAFPAASMAADGHTMAHRRRSGDHEDQRALVSGALDKAVGPAADSVFQGYRQTSSPPTATPSPTPPSRLHTMLRRGTQGQGPSTKSSPCQQQLSLTLDTPPSMSQMRDKIRRQLRQLFIYPAVYIFAWLIPFIMRASGYKPSFALALASLASLCAHGIADALVFSILEKPWRHPRHVAGGSGPLSSWWSGSAGRRGRARADGHLSGGPGRTRDEMHVDGRAARFRRDEELAERRVLRRPDPGAAEPSRDWWDVRLGRLDGWEDDDYHVACDAKGSRAAVAANQRVVGGYSL